MSVDIVWLRNDFRLDDQPAIAAAAERPALFVYVHDERPENGRPPGGASKWRLAKALEAFGARLEARGARLDILAGRADETLLRLAAAADAGRILWTRRYEAEAIALDSAVKMKLRERGVEALSFNGRLMREPWEIAKDGRPPFTFSAFWRRHQGLGALAGPLPAPARLHAADWPKDAPERVPITALGLLPTKPDWSGELAEGETPGEEGALDALEALRRGRSGGLPRATRPAGPGRDVATLGPSAFGEISARRAAEAAERAAAEDPRLIRAAEKFRAELGWRDFAYSLLYALPDIATKPMREALRAISVAQRRDGAARLVQRGSPAIRSWTPACANSGAPATCTTACA